MADNKLALNAGWDNDLLVSELNELNDLDFKVELIGFDAGELEALMFDGDLDKIDPQMVQCPNCAEEFDARDHVKK